MQAPDAPNATAVCSICLQPVPRDLLDIHVLLCSSIFHPPPRMIEPGFFVLSTPFPSAVFPDPMTDFLSSRVMRRIKDVDAAAPLSDASGQDCCICLEPTAAGETRTTSCGHEFCKQCIEKWLSQSTTCPCCKAELGDLHGYELFNSEDGSSFYPEGESATSTDAQVDTQAVETLFNRLVTLQSLLGDIAF